MYIGSHYNGYYNTLFGGRTSSTYSRLSPAQLYQSGLSNYVGGYSNKELFETSGLQYVQGLKTGSSALKSAVRELASGAAFRRQSVVSSDEAVLEVSGAGSKYAGEVATSVTVEQIARAQSNEGEALTAKAVAGQGGAGTQVFTVTVGDKMHELSVAVGAADTNQALQEKMAAAINKAGIGLTAAVRYEGDKSILSVTSNGVGDVAGNRFTIAGDSGGLVSLTGIDQTAQEAQDAVYRIDGGEAKTSHSNTVDIGGGYSATFKKEAQDAVSITKGVDQGHAKQKLDAFVKAYNSLYTAVANNADEDTKAYGLFKQMLGINKTYLGTLSTLGIEFDQDGRMSLNGGAAAKAVEDGSMERFFTDGAGAGYGFANQLTNLADRVNRNTSQYVSQKNLADSLTDSMNYYGYKGSGRGTVNSMFDVGLLFEMWL